MRARFATVATVIGALGAAHGAAASSPGRMVVPPELEAAERAKVSGVGFGRRGKISVVGHQGAFERGSDRITVLGGVYDRRRGGTRFELNGPLFNGPTTAQCGMRKRSLNLGAIEIGSVPLTYQCEFTENGAPLGASLEIQENEGFTGLLAREERTGRATFGEAAFEVRSVHRMRGAIMDTDRPLGYLFERDGRAIGGVETNGAPVVLFAPGLNEAERRAVLLAALALGLFWDPASEP